MRHFNQTCHPLRQKVTWFLFLNGTKPNIQWMIVTKIYFTRKFHLRCFCSAWTPKNRNFHQESVCPPKPATWNVCAFLTLGPQLNLVIGNCITSSVFTHLNSVCFWLKPIQTNEQNVVKYMGIILFTSWSTAPRVYYSAVCSWPICFPIIDIWMPVSLLRHLLLLLLQIQCLILLWLQRQSPRVSISQTNSVVNNFGFLWPTWWD